MATRTAPTPYRARPRVLRPAHRAGGADDARGRHRPGHIDVIALTHAHPDHAWGLVDPDGRPLYPNAVLAVHQAEFDHWTDLSKVDSAPDAHRKDHFRGAHKNLMPYAEAGRIRFITDGDEVATGIRAVATPGHSPGHVVYTITSGGESIVCWGDLCHHQVLLLQRPDWAFQFDFHGPDATAQRRASRSRRWPSWSASCLGSTTRSASPRASRSARRPGRDRRHGHGQHRAPVPAEQPPRVVGRRAAHVARRRGRGGVREETTVRSDVPRLPF